MLSDVQVERYSRQILVPQIGGVGQEKLLAGRVAILGSSDAAHAAATYLIAAGVGVVAVDDLDLDTLVGTNDDSTVTRLTDASLDTFDVVISTQIELEQLSRLSTLAPSWPTVLWGSDGGAWTVIARADAADTRAYAASLLAAAGPADVTAAFWAGSQLALAAIASIVGLAMPHRLQRFAALRQAATATCNPSGET